jgi:hypothetical protein
LVEIEARRGGGMFKIEYKKLSDKPCEHPVLGLVLRRTVKPDKNCCFKKVLIKRFSNDLHDFSFEFQGTYPGEWNPSELAHRLFKDVQYNSYNYKMEWYTKKGSIGCSFLIGDVKPLDVEH